MDENSSKLKDQHHPVEASWIPSTPAKPGLGKQDPVHAEKQLQPSEENRSQQSLLYQGNALDGTCCSQSNSVSDAAEYHSYGNTISHFNKFNNVPHQNLLEYVMAGGTIKDFDSAIIHNALNAESRSSELQCGLETISPNSSMEDQSHFLAPRLHTVPETPHRANATCSSFSFDLNTPPSTMADASSAGISSHFEPITPDQTKKIDKREVSTSSNLCMAVAAEATEVQKEVAEPFELQNNQSELAENQNSATISTVTGENFEPEMAIDQQTDLSKTPMGKPRRKKHRPKVIIEGQSRKPRNPRTPKPTGLEEVVTPKRKYVRKSTASEPVNAPSEGNTKGAIEEAKPPDSEDMPKSKRKYVRRNKVNQPTTPLEDGTPTTTDSSAARVTRRSCKKALNFDTESQVPEGSFSQPHSDFDPKYLRDKEVLVEKTEAGVADELTQSVNHMLNDYLLVKENQAPCISTSCMSSQFMVQNQMESTRGKCQIVFSDVTHDNQASTFKTMASNVRHAIRSSGNSKCSNSTSFSQETQARKSKRRRSYATDALEPCNINAAGSCYNSMQAYQEIIQPNEYNREETSNMHFPAIFKKKRSETFHQSASSSFLHTSITTNYYTRYCIDPSNDLQKQAFPSDATVEINVNTFRCLPTLGKAGKITKRRSKGTTRVRDFDSLLESSRQLPTSCNGMGTSKGQGPHTCMEALASIHATLATKKRSNRIVVSSSSISNNHHQSATKLIGTVFPADIMWRDMSAIDAIVEKINCLSIEEVQNALIHYQEDNTWQNSIVVYQNNGTMVPFDGPFNHIRKRRSRPKVDLDDETTRVWKLLLEDINSEGIDGTDSQKAKWWEEEREVFRLRTESFIARMHLVQGDRRFTPWKGSVVDSVIGVFLTQNVSDHLSSSAFISMAARFPLKSRDHHHPQLFEERSEAPEVLDPNDALEWHKKVSSPLPGIHGSMYNEEEINARIFFGNTSEGTKTTHPLSLSSYTSECGAKLNNEPNVNRFGSQNNEMLASFTGDQKEHDDIISSQSSVVSPHNSVDSIGQTANRSESCSQSSIEAEPTDAASACTSFVELLQMAGTISHGVYNQGCRKTSSYFGNPTKSEGMPYNFPSVNLGCQEIDTSEDSRFFDISKENELSVTEQSGFSPESSAGTSCQNSLSHNHQTPKEVRELVSTVQKQEIHRVYEGSNAQSSSECDFDYSGKKLTMERERNQNAVESNIIDSSNLVDTADEINASTSKAKKRKTNGKEKKDTIDWDNLRKQAQANGKRERTVETMDSVDWEAVRCADVEEIAQTIKERGMNNMLAARIKDFLNRIVRQHESIDLEWLRDIPPDRAKDFLLSIRGLGLKSVECVRLLTLHHLAFPVDTNVGRIAVRLGWVPLQPLPESLQLHLLELYPVLESIQKYLWPRLCKLDQPTLYELHYQMITFGKVFCTKSKPNCNACPMRAECRHFASAYASARLALPAPEERSIISASENESADRNTSENINHLQLPQPEANQQLEASSQIRSLGPIIEEPATPEAIIEEPATPEAIIEEPATPEPEKTQVPDTDIEDILREDAAEIPTIKLNIEELNQTLQNYIQKNIQVQEGEMSKALVVLDAEAASIPMPKLKSINRLRTEHQVYELPDTHPLLQGFDRREPDDPSHYLLAIWTPGETVNSIQPPESTCSFQDSGKLCDQETCFSCNSIREANTQTVRGTLLIPCRTAMKGSFPLNGTYFQVNEMFADHESSLNPIDVPRDWLWNLPRRMVYFGTSIPTIFKGLSQPEIQYCFWRGFVCVRGFDRKSRAPRPLVARLHFPASKLTRTRGRTDE